MAPVLTSKAMLMAAGLGTRLRPFTDITTKALLPVMGVPVAQYNVDSLIQAGVSTIVANVHHDPIRTREGLLALERKETSLILSDESQLLLGSAGGLRKALSHFGGDSFFLANSDVLCDVDWMALAACHKRLRSRWGVNLTLTVFPSGPRGGSYREILFDSQTGLITGLGALSQGRPFFVGAAVIEPEALALVPDGPCEFVPSILQPAIQSRRAGVYFASGTWYDIGSPLLWLETHLSLIHRLEIGDFPNQYARLWKKRLENTNQRICERTWISKKSRHPKNSESWVAPCYWDVGSSELAQPPTFLGPGAVLYGSSVGQGALERGIGYGQKWINLSEKGLVFS
jgi:MurNAc alpha-1-phosphate uridylyltransferase